MADAAKKVDELISLDPRNKEIARLQNIIDGSEKAYLRPTSDWLTENMRFARLKINQIEPDLYDFKLPELLLNLIFYTSLLLLTVFFSLLNESIIISSSFTPNTNMSYVVNYYFGTTSIINGSTYKEVTIRGRICT